MCLNLDANAAGKTISAKDLAPRDKEDRWGDITGVGIGRNWLT